MALYSLQNQRQDNKALFIQANWHIKIEDERKNGSSDEQKNLPREEYCHFLPLMGDNMYNCDFIRISDSDTTDCE